MAGDQSASVGELTTEPVRPQRGPLRPIQLRPTRIRRSRRLVSHVFRLADALAIVVVTAVALVLQPGPVLQLPVAAAVPVVLAAIALAHLLVVAGCYEFRTLQALLPHLAQVVVIAAITGGAAVLLSLLFGAGAAAVRGAWIWTAVSAATLLILHVVWWLLVRHWHRQGDLTPNIVLVGATARAEQFVRETLERRDLSVLGIFDDRLARNPTDVLGVPVLGDTTALLTHRITPHLDLIVVTIDPSAAARVRQIVDKLSVLPNEITMLVETDDATARAAAVRQLTDAPLAPVGRASDPDRKAFAKRVQDLLISVPGLIAVSPILAVIAILIKLDSPGPVFFRQQRHGFNNEAIRVFKFRSMRHELADARAERQVTANDDRVTKMGRILRKTSLDEVPQLINVVRGEMSLVGPRPHAIGMKTGEVESAQLVADYAHRHKIKPGMTGWAAIHGSRGPLHSPAEVQQRVAYDVEYIERQSVWLDLKIIVLTLPALLGDSETIR